MPYIIRKVRNQPCYTVKNSETKKIHSKCTTKAKAKAQVRLLEKYDMDGGRYGLKFWKKGFWQENFPRNPHT